MTTSAIGAADGSELVDSIDTLARHAADYPTSALPERAARLQTLRVLDNVGTLIAGWNASAVAELHALAAGRGAHGEDRAPVMIRGGTLPLRDAAFLHSVMARAHDFCDVMSPGYHPGSTDVPISLAVGGLNRRSGLEVIAALAVGLDVATRINLAAQANGFAYRGFDPNLLALFSGTVVAARLSGLDATATRHALGFAFNHGVGTFQMYSDKMQAVRIAQGTCTAACIDAVMMASRGLESLRRPLDGADGFFAVYAPAPPDRSWLQRGLGTDLLGEDHLCLKPYPSCSVTLALTDACLRLREALSREQPDFRTAGIVIRVSPVMHRICGHPFAPGSTPSIDAMFSVQYVAANALLRGRATLQEFSDAAVRDAAVADLARRIVVDEATELTRFDECEIRLTSPSPGPMQTIRAHTGRGWPPNLLSVGELERKFHDNVCFAALPWLDQRSSELCAAIIGLRDAGGLDPLLALLRPPD